MHVILTGENRQVEGIGESRRPSGESDGAYRSRLAEKMRSSGAQIAWLCVLPGPHVAILIEAALDAGLHVVVEKPWLCSAAVTESLVSKARTLHRVVAIHYEYCLLDEVENWRANFCPGTAFHFGGHFFLGRRDHTGMHAMDNLGSHLLAIKAYAVPQAVVQEVRCGYDQPDERSVWLERGGTRAASINLLENKQPIVQQFMHRVEGAINDGAQFPFDLQFALRVSEEVQALK